MTADYRTEPDSPASSDYPARISRTERIDGALRGRDRGQGHGQGQGQSYDGARRHVLPHAYEQPARPLPHPSAADMASVLGLPADQVTPAVLAALVPLLAEIDRLHWLCEQTEHRLAWLERQADRHSVVPCMTRHALVRELDLLLSGGDCFGMVALLQITGIEALRHSHGLAAGEAALRHVCSHIIGALRNTDVIGCLGGSDFAILMPGADADHARAKLEEICQRLAAPAFQWQDQPVALVPAFGLSALHAGDEAEQVLAAADRSRRGVD